MAHPWHWQGLERPEPPHGLLARGRAAVDGLLAWVGRTPDGHGQASFCAGPGWAIWVDEAPRLPWVDGAVYVRKSRHAASLWLPAMLGPTVPEDLLARQVERACGPGPWLVLDAGGDAWPMRGLQPAAADALGRWREAWQAWVTAEKEPA